MAVRDVALVTVLLIVFGIAFLFFNKIGNDITDNLLNNSIINQSAEASGALQSSQDTINSMMDYWYFALFLGLIISSLILAWIIGGIPLFMGLYFFIGVLIVIFSDIIKNIWLQFASNASLAASITYLPITNHILSNLPMYIAIQLLLGLIVMFSKPYLTSEVP